MLQVRRSIFGVPLLLFSLLSSSAFAEDQPVGKVIAITGTVEFMSSGAESKPDQAGIIRPMAYALWKKVRFLQPVYAADRLRTKKRSRLKILFADNSLMALGPNSEMSVVSYLVRPDEKLRQGVISVAHGFSMYLINKSQTNKGSFSRIISPAANLAARGTQGYISVSPSRTLLANQSGAMEAANSNPSVKGTLICGAMQKTVINKGEPPSKPVPLAYNELNMIRTVLVGRIVGVILRRPGEKPLIEVREEGGKGEGGKKSAGDQARGGGLDKSGGFVDAFVAEAGGGSVADFMPLNQPFDVSGQGGGGCTP